MEERATWLEKRRAAKCRGEALGNVHVAYALVTSLYSSGPQLLAMRRAIGHSLCATAAATASSLLPRSNKLSNNANNSPLLPSFIVLRASEEEVEGRVELLPLLLLLLLL